jgi:phospholipase/lecithinase/hemolysin
LPRKLYQSGARNFLFLTVPPVWRSPLTIAAGTSSQQLEKSAIFDFNSRIVNLANSLRREHTDVTLWVHDTYDVFNNVLNWPGSYPQTEGYKNTTAYCDVYAKYAELGLLFSCKSEV